LHPQPLSFQGRFWYIYWHRFWRCLALSYPDVKTKISSLYDKVSQGRVPDFGTIHGDIAFLQGQNPQDAAWQRQIYFLSRKIAFLEENNEMLSEICRFARSLNERVTVTSLSQKFDQLQRLQSAYPKAMHFLEGIKKRLARQIRRATKRSFREWIARRSISKAKLELKWKAFFSENQLLAGMQKGPSYVVCFKRWFLSWRVARLAKRIFALGKNVGDLDRLVRKGNVRDSQVQEFQGAKKQLQEHVNSFMALGVISQDIVESMCGLAALEEQFQDWKLTHGELAMQPGQDPAELICKLRQMLAVYSLWRQDTRQKAQTILGHLEAQYTLTAEESVLHQSLLQVQTLDQFKGILGMNFQTVDVILEKKCVNFLTLENKNDLEYWKAMLDIDLLFRDCYETQVPEAIPHFQAFQDAKIRFFGEKPLSKIEVFHTLQAGEDQFLANLTLLENTIEREKKSLPQDQLAQLERYHLNLKILLKYVRNLRLYRKDGLTNERQIVHHLSLLYRSREFFAFAQMARVLIQDETYQKALQAIQDRISEIQSQINLLLNLLPRGPSRKIFKDTIVVVKKICSSQ